MHAIHSSVTRSAATPAENETAALRQRLSALYDLSQTHPHVFASPIGPFTFRRRSVWLPRLVFFGPHATDDAWRLAFFGSFEARDLRPAHGLLGAIEALGRDAENGHGLNLTFFPLVDAGGLAAPAPHRELAHESWRRPQTTEIALLSRDVRLRGYHGFVRVESAPPGEDHVSVCIQGPEGFGGATPDVELISSDALAPLDVRFERATGRSRRPHGPLELADDLGVQPFELTVRIPADWSRERYEQTATHVLIRFVHHYRAFHAFGGEL